MTLAELEPHQPLTAERAAPGPEKRVFIRRLFTDIAPRYDWFNRLASFGMDRRWRREAVKRGGIGPGQRVLDVCGGTGELAILCAREVRGDGMVVGIDFTAAMLAHAARKQRVLGLRIAWLQGDALALPFPDRSFDRVMIGFSTRNLADLTAGLREMLRVLRAQGRLIVLETGHPANPLIRAGYQVFLLTMARTIGFVLTGRCWPFTYLARSVRQFLTPKELMERLQQLGASAVYVPLSGGLASLYVATRQ